MKKAIVIILAVATVAAGIFWVVKGRRPPASEARVDFCARLKDYGEAVVNLRSIDQDSTVEELKDAQKAVQESWADLQPSAATLRAVKLDALQESYAELENTIQNIPNDAALAGAQSEIYLAALNTLASALAADQATCKFTVINASSSADLMP